MHVRQNITITTFNSFFRTLVNVQERKGAAAPPRSFDLAGRIFGSSFINNKFCVFIHRKNAQIRSAYTISMNGGVGALFRWQKLVPPPTKKKKRFVTGKSGQIS